MYHAVSVSTHQSFKESPEIKGIETRFSYRDTMRRCAFKESPEIKGIETHENCSVFVLETI